LSIAKLYDSAIQFVVDQWVPGKGPVLKKGDWLFLGHHLVTVLYMTSVRIIRAGHMSAMALMLFGEASAPIMNLWRISKTAVTLETADWLLAAHTWIEYAYAVLYICFRAVVGPACGAHLTSDLLLTKKGRMNVPVQLSIIWVAMCWGVMLGSFPWIKRAMNILGGQGSAI
jgi:hypothetical protein